ncbi:MAG: YIP1 family protein [Acidimicrobiia bacterium]|nr:YIP1 family protein [Acidimicrobiia bacterium]
METLVDRLKRALKLDGAVYGEIAADPAGTGQALLVTAVAFAIGGLSGDGSFFGNVIGSLVAGVIGLIIWAGVVLLMGKLFSGQATYTDLIRGLGLTAAPFALGVIPFLGILGLVYSLVMQVRAVRELHKISDGAAVVIVLVPWIIFMVLAVIVALAIGAALFGLAVS